MRQIDADKLKKSMERMLCTGKDPLKERYTCDVVCCVIDEEPTVDAEPVRCDECVCCSMCDDQLICSRIADVMDGYYRGTVEVVKPDDYCSKGIRRTAKDP